MRTLIATASKLAAGLIVLACAAPALAGTPAEFFNEFDWAPLAPTPGPTNFEIVFAGNVACKIPPQNQNNASTNPFKNPNPITTTFDPGTGNTTVMFSGSALRPGGRYHFGLNQGFAPTPPLQIVAKMWTYDAAPPSPLPIINVTPPAPTSPNGPFKYAVVYLEAAFNPGAKKTYGSWYEVPYTPGAGNGAAVASQPVLKFDNFGSQPLYIVKSGIQTGLPVPTNAKCKTSPTCLANTNLLNRLDFAKMPPPGLAGSKFVPLAVPPPATLMPTKVVTAVACAIDK